MLKLGGNTTISFPGAFFIGFLWFLFMIVFYLAYEIHVQNFVRLCWIVVEICWNWVEVLPFHYGCVFYSISLISFCEHVLFRLRNTRTKFCVAVLCGCGDMLKMGWNRTDNDNVNAQKKEAEIGCDDVIASSTCCTVSAQAASHGPQRQQQVTFGSSPLGNQEYKGGRNRPLWCHSAVKFANSCKFYSGMTS